jgi:hypothetical protein
MADSGARGDAGGYFALLKELREFWEELLGGEPSLRAMGRAAAANPKNPVKPDTVKAWLGGQFPQDAGKLVAVVRAVAAVAEAKGIVPASRQVDALDVEQWRNAYEEEARRRAGEVSAGALRGQAARALAGMAAGRLLIEVTDPFDLEVHQPLHLDGLQRELPGLPAYVPREHDQALAEVVRAAAEGRSGIAVLVGGSSTGKTRACWEALELLRGRPERWRLWHPIDPSRPKAALRDLSSIGPRTVVWLNEAQFYLDVADDDLGERVAAGLRELLRDRAPVLVLATLWPEYWAPLTARPAAGADPHAQARELLAGRDIQVPPAFTEEQMRQLPAAGDPRLVQAAESAEDRQVIQFLAGASVLLARYRNAPPGPRALISAAMDARRLGMGVALPLAFLEQTAPGYLTDAEWDELGDDWLEQALAYTAELCNGIRGPLTRIRPRPARSAGPAKPTVHRLADYLEQQGRGDRRALIPPGDFWDAAVRFAAPADLPALARAAETRGLLRDAARLRKHATAHGSPTEAAALVRNWPRPRAADPGPAQWAAAHAVLDDPAGVALLLGALREAGTEQQAAALAGRAAAHAALDDPAGVALLVGALREAGAEQQAAALASRAAAHAVLDTPIGVAFLLGALRRAGAGQQAGTLVDRLPREGFFDLFYQQPGHAERYRFGRESDGSPAPSWGWDHLD